MIQVTRTALPVSGRVRVVTGALPRAARLGATSLDALARAMDDARIAASLAGERARAHGEATRTAAEALNRAAARLDEARERAVETLSADAVALGVEIARQILKVEIQASHYDLEQIVRATLAASDVKRGHCVVHLHPDDAAMLEGIVFRGETVLHPDGEIPRGTVQVETPRGLLVREPDAALEEIREQLLEDLV